VLQINFAAFLSLQKQFCPTWSNAKKQTNKQTRMFAKKNMKLYSQTRQAFLMLKQRKLQP